MSGYDNIAGFYDRVTGDSLDTEKYILNKVKGYFKIDSRNKPRLLELGCGTGNNLFFLKDKFELTGIDSSVEMLKIARRKLPEADFHRKDFRKFDLKNQFDIILCLYDTINHITLFSDWKKVFRNANLHLKKNGLFIFDINTLHKLEFISSVSPVVNKFENSYLIVNVKKISRNVFNWNLKVFENTGGNNFRLIETDIKESSFEVSKITEELSKHFRIVKTEEESGRRMNPDSERLYFVCRKL
ncbi:MAG: class I SAM-dependent methyltransferase [Bacteroidetes bacterium]|nr:class I SAM-dependent methyltransferase [Bacteroidota bacterium]